MLKRLLSFIKPRNYLFPIFFLVSSFLVVWFMMGFAEDSGGKVVCASIGVCIEIIAQIIYYYGRKLLRTLKPLPIIGAVILFIIYLAYIGIFSVPSAITYFATTTAYYEQQNERQLYNIDQTKERLKQVNKRIETLNRYLDAESKTGYGSRSKEVMNQLSQLTIEQEKLTSKLQKTSLTKKSIEKDRFGLLGMIYGIPGNRVMIFIFGAAVFMIYLGLIVTSPDGSSLKTEPEVLYKKEEVTQKSHCEVPEVVRYVEALIGDNPNKLNGNETISKRTKIGLKKCAEYRDKIKRMVIDGRPAIETKQGWSFANFPMEVIVERLREG